MWHGGKVRGLKACALLQSGGSVLISQSGTPHWQSRLEERRGRNLVLLNRSLAHISRCSTASLMKTGVKQLAKTIEDRLNEA